MRMLCICVDEFGDLNGTPVPFPLSLEFEFTVESM